MLLAQLLKAQLFSFPGRDDRQNRVPRGTRRRLRPDRHPGHQKGSQVSVESAPGKSRVGATDDDDDDVVTNSLSLPQ